LIDFEGYFAQHLLVYWFLGNFLGWNFFTEKFTWVLFRRGEINRKNLRFAEKKIFSLIRWKLWHNLIFHVLNRKHFFGFLVDWLVSWHCRICWCSFRRYHWLRNCEKIQLGIQIIGKIALVQYCIKFYYLWSCVQLFSYISMSSKTCHLLYYTRGWKLFLEYFSEKSIFY